MSRPLRIEYPGAVYHVMNRGSDCQVRIPFNSETGRGEWGTGHGDVPVPKTGRAQVEGNWAGGWLGEVLIGEHGVFEDAGADCQGAKTQTASPTN